MEIRSPAFKDGSRIPVEYTCDGDDISPPLLWHGHPDNTDSFVLICEDPDAPDQTWSHWVLYNLPPTANELDSDIPPSAFLENEALHGAQHGTNDFGDTAYGGPCPPEGTHNYVFRLFALDTMLDLEAGVTREDILQMIEPHIIEEAQLIGFYGNVQGA